MDFDLIDLVIVLALIVSLVLAVFCFDRIATRRWMDRWRAISDDEFLAKCSPGVDPGRALKVRKIMSEQLGIPYDRIHPDQSFVDGLGCK